MTLEAENRRLPWSLRGGTENVFHEKGLRQLPTWNNVWHALVKHPQTSNPQVWHKRKFLEISTAGWRLQPKRPSQGPAVKHICHPPKRILWGSTCLGDWGYYATILSTDSQRPRTCILSVFFCAPSSSSRSLWSLSFCYITLNARGALKQRRHSTLSQ